ncbi:MAG: hypothetical protein OXH90_06135 [Paracoccaceae bacterium]|nr:hypothetical protein [Paracoccaceae bacterium]MDE2917728.1 hypothetical protein [Paracoccaceae bacterium]
MDIEQMLMLTENRLLQEGSNMGFLLEKAKRWTPASLVEEKEWDRILACAQNLPISMGAYPFGFEFPLHKKSAAADFGVTLVAGSSTDNVFYERTANNDKLADSIVNLFKEMDGEDSSLRDVVGRKLTLEFDVGSATNVISELPGFFLRPNQYRPKVDDDKIDDVFTIINALFSSVGWKLNQVQRQKLAQIYSAQPYSTCMDSFGIFPSRPPPYGIRLAIMGFNSPKELKTFLKTIEWPDDISIVDRVAESFLTETNIAHYGVNLDIQEEFIGPNLGVTFGAKNRFTNDPGYWLDDTNLWSTFLDTLYREEIVIKEKLAALGGWISKPEILFGKTGHFLLLRGIHHMKLVISNGQFSQVKAYVYMILSALDQSHRII